MAIYGELGLDGPGRLSFGNVEWHHATTKMVMAIYGRSIVHDANEDGHWLLRSAAARIMQQ
jgi:hypothetical protein